MTGRIWSCKIGEASELPHGADMPMRSAVAGAFRDLTGREPLFLLSGWGASLTESEAQVVEGIRLQRLLKAADEMYRISERKQVAWIEYAEARKDFPT